MREDAVSQIPFRNWERLARDRQACCWEIAFNTSHLHGDHLTTSFYLRENSIETPYMVTMCDLGRRVGLGGSDVAEVKLTP